MRDLCKNEDRATYTYGYLAPREAIPTPWFDVHIDTVGNWPIKIQGQQEALTRSMHKRALNQ